MTKVVILAGGFGTRISEYTKTIPKPMIRINKKPILVHIMEHYVRYGFKSFYIAIGYKGSVIKKYFKKKKFNWNINLVDTGLKTMTGGRLKRMQKFIGNETFLLTYGDGVANVDIGSLIAFHKNHGNLVTMTAVRPSARFGELELVDNNVSKFLFEVIRDNKWSIGDQIELANVHMNNEKIKKMI